MELMPPRGIRKLVPCARIIFLTQESSTDMVREAFSLGACGYVLKAYAGDELLGALQAAVHCKEFVSNGLGRDVTRETKTVQFSEK